MLYTVLPYLQPCLLELCNLRLGYSQKKPETSLVAQKQAQSIAQKTEDLKVLRFGIERDTCTPVFIAALFVISRAWKQPRCPMADKWIRKLWYIYTVECYSAIKKNAFESVLMRWMKLEPIIQSEVSQKEKHQYSMLMHIYEI